MPDVSYRPVQNPSCGWGCFLPAEARQNFTPSATSCLERMMTEWEREKLMLEAAAIAAEVHARGGDVRPALAPLFEQALRRHPNQEAILIELWDKVTSRPVL